ncbi:DUF58 domain-containing protein [uncultured Agrococcus sp.]|uniref:DUF58 domain-containing protein n=1 Tax=uncultured Agrococcus sp. TaxID=382258 RepID=UPI0025FC5945|nr:DUF58 domain-containing protein [uncultured Agrococcus sp.]
MRTFRKALRVVTGWGWALAAVVVLLGALGFVLSWNELIVLSVGALILLFTAVPWILRGRGVRIELQLSSPRVAVGSPAFAVLVARRSGRLSMPHAVEVEIGKQTIEVALPRLARGQSNEIRLPIDTSRRGKLEVGPVRIAHTDPLGILERLTVLSVGQTLMVHPRTVRVPAASSGLVKDLEGEPSQDLTADDVAFHSLREYQPGDDRRLVHWRTSAKHGSLLVRQFEPSRRSDTLVCLTTSQEEIGPENFELALSVVATIGIATMVERRSIRVLSGPMGGSKFARELDTRGRDWLLDELTEIQRHGQSGLKQIITSLSRSHEPALAWLVVGAETPPRTLREAIARVPVDVEPVIIRVDEGASPGISKLGTVPALTIGVLEDLARNISSGVRA